MISQEHMFVATDSRLRAFWRQRVELAMDRMGGYGPTRAHEVRVRFNMVPEEELPPAPADFNVYQNGKLVHLPDSLMAIVWGVKEASIQTRNAAIKRAYADSPEKRANVARGVIIAADRRRVEKFTAVRDAYRALYVREGKDPKTFTGHYSILHDYIWSWSQVNERDPGVRRAMLALAREELHDDCTSGRDQLLPTRDYVDDLQRRVREVLGLAPVRSV